MARRVDYFFKETFQGLRRNGLVAFAAVSTAFIALFLFGGALLGNRQVGLLIERSTANVEVSVYLRDDISQSQQQHLLEKLQAMPQVGNVHYESKDEAYTRFLTIFKNEKDIANNISRDALPASFRVKLKDPSQFEVVAAQLAGEPGIDKIYDSRQILRRLFALARVFKIGIMAVALIMGISAAALIGNTVRMAVFARRKEIGIMRLVGATNWHIRLPFLIEGMMEGLIGAGVAILGLFIMKVAFVDPLRDNIGFIPLIGSPDVVNTIVPLIIAGVVVSGLASLVGMRRYLEV